MTKKLAEAIRHYVAQIKARGQVTTPLVLKAFGKVPRELFVGKGPWRTRSEIVTTYGTTESDDPVHLYHDVMVALDETRTLDNGLPSLWARLIDALDLKKGENVLQIGCGSGYYTAVLAEIVGTSGSVTAVESEAKFAALAKELLEDRSNVQVIHGDGCQQEFSSFDAIIVHAGVSHPHAIWLDALAMNGRLQVPMTASGRQNIVFQITRRESGYEAQAVRRIETFPCDEGANKSQINQQLAFWNPVTSGVNSLRRDEHEAEETCWLHSEDFCLSKVSVLIKGIF